MNKKYSYNPDYAIPPAETLIELLDDRSMSLRELSELSSISLNDLSKILKAELPVDLEVATNLERALGIKKSFWINLEDHYQHTKERLK